MVGGERALATVLAEESCRVTLERWEADPYPTQYVQVDASVLRALLDRLDTAATAALDLRAGTLELS